MKLVNSNAEELSISPAGPDHLADALHLLLGGAGGADPAQRATLLADARSGKLSRDGLFVALRRRSVVGAVWACLQPGGSALVWPPRLARSEDEHLALRLLEQVDCYLADSHAKFAQVMLGEPARASFSPDPRVLTAAGYSEAAQLDYLLSRQESFPTAEPGRPLRYERYRETDHARLGALIERTYSGALDCPMLNNTRSGAEALEGYRHTGASGARHWWIVRRGEGDRAEDVGCVLLADHPANQHLELAYMGLTPQARGRGWGFELARFAQWRARQTGRSGVVLAADAANRPALAAYQKAGFLACGRQSVWLKIYRSSAPCREA